MNKMVLVLRYELLTVLKSKSFLFLAFALPLIGSLIFLGVAYLGDDAVGKAGGAADDSEGPELWVEGYVDPGGIISEIPSHIPEGILLAFADEASAQQALDDGLIEAYYLIPADYVAEGDLIHVYPGYRPTADGQSWVMRNTLFSNLLGNDPEQIEQAGQPMEVSATALKPEAVRRDDDNPLTFAVPYATMLIFYMVILMSASLLLNSVSNEKKDRVLEVLLASVSPRQMLTGKIIGLGILGLLQTVIWVSVGYALLSLSGRMFDLPPGFEVPPSILFWGVVFFLLGYAVYASLMAGLGALVPNLKEASQAVILVIWPLIIPMLLLVALIEKPNGALATGLSIFPLTAPVAMMTRLVATSVPWWQLLVAVLLLVGTAFLIVRAVAGMFHAQTMLSGQPFTAKRFLRALTGRV